MKKIVAEVKDKSDVIVLAYHADIDEEFNVVGSGTRDIADACPDIDVILGAHGHQTANETRNGVLITENVNQGATMGDIDITLKSDGNGGYTVENKTAEIIELKDVAADAEMVAALASYDERAKEDAVKKVGTLKGGDLVPATEIPGVTQFQIQETAMMNLINKVQMYYSGADVSAAAILSPEANMKQGDIRKCDMALIYKFDNTLYKLEMTGKQLKQYMEWSMKYYKYAEIFRTVPYSLDNSFNPAIPITIKHTQIICGTDSFSLNKNIPRIVVPMIPNPVHIAYAVPRGRCFRARDRKTALARYPITVITDGSSIVNPFEYFIAIAHVTSNIPAMINNIHCILFSS